MPESISTRSQQLGLQLSFRPRRDNFVLATKTDYRSFIRRQLFTVRRRLRRTFSTHFEIFRRRFDGVVIYFIKFDFKFFDDASKFSVTSFYVVFIFS